MKTNSAFIKWGVISIIAMLFCWLTYIYVTLDESYVKDQMFFTSIKVVKAELQSHYYGKKNYSKYSLKDLLKNGIISEDSYNSLKEYNVKYFPFSGDTPNDQIIIKVKQDGLFGRVVKIKKKDFIKEPDQVSPYSNEASGALQ